MTFWSRFEVIGTFTITGNRPPVGPIRLERVFPRPGIDQSIGDAAQVIGEGHEILGPESQENVSVAATGQVNRDVADAEIVEPGPNFVVPIGSDDDFPGHGADIAAARRAGNGERAA